MIDFDQIEKKWLNQWREANIFETDVTTDNKFFITVPYPYINGPPHLGFLYTIFRADMIARYKRLRGYNVLFSQGFHATGEPLAGAAKRVEKGEESIINSLKESGVPPKEIKDFKKPEKFVEFYYKKWINDLQKVGLAIDWRRTFHTTSLNPAYNKFIRWQFEKLKKWNLIAKRSHPVIYCPSCESPTSAHDRQQGENAEIIDYNIIKIEGDDFIYPSATLRPETIYGATNVWVNPKVEYIIAKKGEKRWIMSQPALEKLKHQGYDIQKVRKIFGRELVGKTVKIPIINKMVPVLPANFVQPDNGTGVVMSVPAHAPYDYIGLQDLKDRIDEVGELAREIEPVAMISLPSYSEYPAKEICEKLGIQTQNERENLEKATETIYEKEFHNGVLRENCGEFAGRKVDEAKDTIVDTFTEKEILEKMYETTEKVICRCMTECHVKTIKNQYFLRYGDETWKNKVKRAIETVTNIVPKQAENEFRSKLENLKDKPCARQSGLGTPLPWNPDWIVEPLSDSTIYMAYYILAKYVSSGKIDGSNLNPDFFDYIFLNKGDPEKVAEKSKIPSKMLKEIQREFEYFYPVDVRVSGKDLITNHLIYYLYNHVAFWDEEKWPRTMSLNGFVMLRGKELSKSKGHIITVEEALTKFGSDPTRVALLDTSEGLEDTNFRPKDASSIREKIKGIIEWASKIEEYEESAETLAEKWLQAKIQERIEKTTNALEQFKNRTALKHAFHGLWRDINVYLSRRSQPDSSTVMYAFSVLARLLVPFTPHTAEEIWKKIGKEGFIHEATWPEVKDKYKNKRAIAAFTLIENTRKDIHEILNILKKEPKEIKIFIAKEWKRDLFRDLSTEIRQRDKNFDNVISTLMQKSNYREKGNSVVQIAKRVFNNPSLFSDQVFSQNEEKDFLMKGKTFLEKEFNADVKIMKEGSSKEEKANKALPSKPAILIE